MLQSNLQPILQSGLQSDTHTPAQAYLPIMYIKIQNNCILNVIIGNYINAIIIIQCTNLYMYLYNNVYSILAYSMGAADDGDIKLIEERCTEVSILVEVIRCMCRGYTD